MADHERVDAHRGSIVSMVSRRLSPLFRLLDDTAKFIVSAREALRRGVEARACACGVLEEEAHTVLPRSAGTFGIGAAVDLHHVVGEVEHAMDAVGTRGRRWSADVLIT